MWIFDTRTLGEKLLGLEDAPVSPYVMTGRRRRGVRKKGGEVIASLQGPERLSR